MRKQIIILLPTDDYDRIDDAERLEGHNFNSLEEIHNEFDDEKGQHLVYTLPNFMLHTNDQVLNLESYWLTYVNLLS